MKRGRFEEWKISERARRLMSIRDEGGDKSSLQAGEIENENNNEDCVSDGGENDDEEMKYKESKECQGEGRVKVEHEDEGRGNWKNKELEIGGRETGEVEKVGREQDKA